MLITRLALRNFRSFATAPKLTTVGDVLRELRFAGDGPVTRYVAICRAVEMARSGRAPVRADGFDPLAEALNAAIDDLDRDGDIPSDEQG